MIELVDKNIKKLSIFYTLKMLKERMKVLSKNIDPKNSNQIFNTTSTPFNHLTLTKGKTKWINFH